MSAQPSRFAGWPTPVPSLSELASPLREVAEETLAGQSTAQMLFVPWDDRTGRPRGPRNIYPSHFIARTPGAVLVFRGVEGGEPEVKHWRIPLDKLLAIEWGQILLYSWVRFVFAAPAAVGEVQVQYNTVGVRYVWPLLAGIMAEDGGNQPLEDGPEALQVAANLPLKFRNALQSQLLPRERVLAVAFQPWAVEGPFWPLRRVRFVATLLACTNQHVLLMEEDSPSSREDARWGIIATYFPLSRVGAVSAYPVAEDDLRLRITVGNGGIAWQAERKFGPDARAAIQNCAERIESVVKDREAFD